MEKIILDTNFLLAISQFKIDIFEEISRIAHFSYKLYVFDKTIGELNKLKNIQKTKLPANIALAMIKNKNIDIIKTNTAGSVDDILKKQPENVVIATQDQALKKSLKNHTIIGIRQKRYLILKNRKIY